MFEAFFSGCKDANQQLVNDFFGSLVCGRREEGQINCIIVLDILQKSPGFHLTASEPKRAQLVGPDASITPPKFNETTPKRGRKNENCGGRGEKKSEILGSTLLGSTLLGSTLLAPTLCRPKIQHPKNDRNRIGRSRNWPKSKLAEVDRAPGFRF